jgi:hypothetical protein
MEKRARDNRRSNKAALLFGVVPAIRDAQRRESGAAGPARQTAGQPRLRPPRTSDGASRNGAPQYALHVPTAVRPRGGGSNPWG